MTKACTDQVNIKCLQSEESRHLGYKVREGMPGMNWVTKGVEVRGLEEGGGVGKGERLLWKQIVFIRSILSAY